MSVDDKRQASQVDSRPRGRRFGASSIAILGLAAISLGLGALNVVQYVHFQRSPVTVWEDCDVQARGRNRDGCLKM